MATNHKRSLLQTSNLLLKGLLKDIHCAESLFGITSKMLYVEGRETESEFSDAYNIVFIRQHGTPSALRCNNANPGRNQRFNGPNHIVYGRIQQNYVELNT
jgi:hypothetical protein